MGQGKMKRRRTPTKAIEQEISSKTSDDDVTSRIPLTHPKVSIEVGDQKSVSGFRLSALKCVAITSTFMSVILLTIIIIMAHHLGALQYCFPGHHVLPRDLENPGVFEDMTPVEFRAVRDYMLQKSKIGLVPIDEASVNNSYIFMIDLHIPLKSAVLEYLDRGSVRLQRAAKVTVVRGDLESPKVEEYLVSPLPKPNKLRLARNPSYARFPIPYTSRPTDQVDYKYLFPILTEFSKQVYHILIESYGLSHHNCTRRVNCLNFYDVAPRGRQSGDRKTWFWAFRDVEGFYLHPLGLEIQIEHESNDVTKWRIDKVVYNGHLFYSVKDFIELYADNKLRKIQMQRPVGRENELYSSYHRRGTSEMPHPRQGPKLTEPDGHRYQITGQHVKYMHWDFDLRMRTSTGVQLFDVRFQSERIAYEISLQDAVVFYTGYGPAQSMSNYYDTSWMMGASSFELVRGVDCPDTAAYLDADHFVNSDTPRHYRNSICVFEHNPGIPLRRHYANNFDGGYTEYGGIVDYQLVVRNIANIWNYDYIFDYIFHLNGEIEVKVSATGYVQATYKLPFEKPYGNTIFYDVMADLHQHLFHYKIDLDIGGVKNSFSTLNIGTETVRHPWYANTNKTQMTFNEKHMVREMDIVVDESTDPKYHLIYSSTALNKYKAKRSYRILNKAETQFLIEDVPVTNAAKWAKYPLVVTKYDDTEDQSSSIFAQNDPWDPVVDFERFLLDNDTIVNEDLVAWVTLGVHHIPHTEDVPSTPTSWNQFVFHLVPFNFFTECPSVSSPNMVHIQPTDTTYKHIQVDTHGTSFKSTCVAMTYGPETFYGYWGDEE